MDSLCFSPLHHARDPSVSKLLTTPDFVKIKKELKNCYAPSQLFVASYETNEIAIEGETLRRLTSLGEV